MKVTNCNLGQSQNTVQVALKLDRPHALAGSIISGRVFLSLPPNVSTTSSLQQSLRVQLHGYERITEHPIGIEHNGRCHKHAPHKPNQATKTIVLTDCFPTVPLPLIDDNTKQSAQCWEYPFYYQMPAHLPTSLFCLSEDNNTVVAELRYTVTASIVDSSGSNITAATVLYVQAATPSTTVQPSESDTACLMHPVILPLLNSSSSASGWLPALAFWKKRGTVRLGWETDKTVYQTNDCLTADVTIDHAVSVPITAVTVACLETLTWNKPSTAAARNSNKPLQRLTVRCLTQQTVPAAEWMSRDRDEQEPRVIELKSATARLRIPTSARDSLAGELIQVSHSLTVTVETADGGVATLLGPLTIVRGAQSPCSAQSKEVAPTVATQDKELADPSMTWRTVTMQNDLRSNPQQPSSSDCSTTTGANLAFMLAAAECDDGWQCQEPCRRQQLQSLLARHAEQLLDLVQDATWATTVQRLSPCDYCSAVASVPTKAADAAVSLAVTMGDQFTVMHVLAAVRHTPYDTGMECLRRTLRLASDLTERQAWLEAQLNSNELVHFKAALAPC